MTLFHNYECSNGDGTGIAGNYRICAGVPACRKYPVMLFISKTMRTFVLP